MNISPFVPNVPYWVEYDADDKLWAISPHKRDPKYHPNLRVVEFDDQGDSWESDQRKSVERLIEAQAEGSTVFVFIHGWQNNADPRRSPNDLERFNHFLHSYADAGNQIIGIYIGWRGRSVKESFPLSSWIDKLSFPARRSTTTRVAGIVLADTLWRFRLASNLKKNRVILMGHSFGGRILEQAASFSILAYFRGLLSEAIDSDARGYRENMLLGDIVLLVNPASESLQAKKMRMATRIWSEYEPPAIISVTSKSDNATKQIWWIGRNYERFTSVRDRILKRNYRLGHYQNPDPSLPSENQSSYITQTAGHDQRLINGEIHLTGSQIEFVAIDTDKTIKHRLPTGGYPVFQLPPSILDGHSGLSDTNGIFNPDMIRVLELLLEQTAPSAFPTSSLAAFLREYRRKHEHE